ncbi:MAG: branched-chain amino acid ABC transporter substrate-binding protein, partial [Xanthobacteraceae bacterium]
MKSALLRGVATALLLAAASAAADAQIAVGHLADYSGATADVGVPFGQGTADAMAFVNQKGGVNGTKV